MIELKIKLATCRVACGSESGTGWLVAKNLVLTARHCILSGLDGMPVELYFSQSEVATSCRILAHSEDNDACLLTLENALGVNPLPLDTRRPPEGATWETFGYPQTKQTIGHRLSGNVAQTLNEPKLKIDLDLSIEQSTALRVYQGMSGAVVVCEGAAVGMIRIKCDGTIGALSIRELESFLTENGVVFPKANQGPIVPLLAARGDFLKLFADAVQSRAGNYLFIEGAHGYGKTTFCSNFPAIDGKLFNLGAYCLLDANSPLGPEYRAHPQVFLEWLATAVSVLIMGQPARKVEKSYLEQTNEFAQYLSDFSEYCEKTGKHGVFFLDGLNEIPVGPKLGELIGLLPRKLPSHVTVVLTAPNFSSVSGQLAARVKTSDVFVLPQLLGSECYRYCELALNPDRRLPELIDRICLKAKGHPLYLRYIIEYVNAHTQDNDLSEFPVLTGPIEDYYDGIWAKLVSDEGAVNLLAIMARLRWGLQTANFIKALNSVEQARFVTTFQRIRHLLAGNDNTGIYHSSFALFVIDRTSAIDDVAYARLAEYCRNQPGIRYCVLNRVFHQLKADDTSVFSDCSQNWVDKAVILGVEPDALLADVNAVISRAAMVAPVEEFIRLTLLSQRISFRYDTLFAISARLIAEALITIGRPREALQHVLRFNTLIIGPDDALQIGFILIQYSYDHEALMLLDRVQQRILENYGDSMELHEVLGLCSWHIQTLLLMRLASDGSGMPQVMRVLRMAREACKDALKDEPAELSRYLLPIESEPATYFLTFRNQYAELAALKAHMPSVPSYCLALLSTMLLKFEDSVNRYGLDKDRSALEKVYADLAELIPKSDLDASLADAVTDTLILLGAPVDIIIQLAGKSSRQGARRLKIVAGNGIDVDHSDLGECRSLWRVSAFLDPEFLSPASGVFLSAGWLNALELLMGALFWCDGKARRAKSEGNEEARIVCLEKLKSCVLDPLGFTLKQRVSWRDSYAIPENALPAVYRQAAELLADCFPEQVSDWLDVLLSRVDTQWGLYSEGFRDSIHCVVSQLTRSEPSEELAFKLMGLLRAWRDHVMKGVENRHELVPEILRMIPLFSAVGANEDGDLLYSRLLSVSMGPTWYKEDQLCLMTDAIRNMAPSSQVLKRLPRVAGYLEKGAGEMTFQRYVRAEKTSLLGHIVRLQSYREAITYFKRQCCGSISELWKEAQQGPIDRVGPLQGNRFPGGALDDQSAALSLAKNFVAAPWELRWALLEVFQCGDSRHLSDYGKAFAEIANTTGGIKKLVQRIAFVANAETPSDKREEFLLAFREALSLELHESFGEIFTGLPPQKAPAPVAHRKPVDDDDQGFFLAGTIGRRKAKRDADTIVEEAKRQQTLGNRKVAKATAVKALKVIQEGEWSIWGYLSGGSPEAEAIIIEGETSAANVIRHYAPLIEGEKHAPRWIPTHHLIEKIGVIFTEAESLSILDSVIDHVHLMVGDAEREIEEYDFLSKKVSEQDPTVELFELFVWLCNHPQFIRRDRAAAALLWVVGEIPEIFNISVMHAFSLEEGYGPDILCGVLDGASAREPIAVWDKLMAATDVDASSRGLRHCSRMAVLLRLANRAAESGSVSANAFWKKSQILEMARKRGGRNQHALPWAECLDAKMGQLGVFIDKDVSDAWEAELKRLCIPLKIEEAFALENLVSASFREKPDKRYNRWESKVRHALNLALCSRVSTSEASEIEAVLRIFNPSQPEREVIGISNSFTDQILAAISSSNLSGVFNSATALILNHHDVVAEQFGRTVHLEVLCLIQPTAQLRRFFPPSLDQSFRSSELPQPSVVSTPVETCSHLEPEAVFFGAFTPAIPLPFFQRFVGAKDGDFLRQSWRYGRRSDLQALGKAEREGCSLSVNRQSLSIPSGFKFTWMVWLDGKVIAFVDEFNNSLI